MAAAARLEEVLARLLTPDNDIIQQATKELQVVYKDLSIISPLCEIIMSSQNPQIRQYAAVILRKKLVKVWKRLSAEDRERTKVILLQCTSQEKIPIVLRSIAHLVSVIAKHELSLNQWNELNQFVLQSCNSPEPGQREAGMIVLSSLMDTAAVELQPQFPALLQLFSAALDDQTNKMVPFYALKSLTSMVEYIGSAELPLFQSMIPKVINIIKIIIESDEDKACEAMELFDELVECDVGIVVPHLTTLIRFCLDLACTMSLGNSIRVKALSFVSWLITLKKKTLLRHGLLPTIITTMLQIMSTPGEDEDESPDEDDTSESQSPVTLAGQVLDVLALNLPPEKIYTPVMQHVQLLLQSANKFERSAALVAIAVISEGCSEYIKNKHLTGLLQSVYNGVNDSERVVRNSALFAIGQFAEHLQPDISTYHSNLVPVLIEFMERAITSLQTHPQEKTGITKIFYALETFCEHLGTGLVPYLSTLMEKLFCAISMSTNVHVQELILSAFGAAASACQEQLAPYFPRLIAVLKGFIRMQYSQEHSILQSQAVDTLGTLARTIGEENFRPLAQECIATGMTLMLTTDPDLRRSVYGLLASVSCILKDEMAVHLEPIIQRMMESLTSEMGVKVHYASFQVDFLDFEEDGEQNSQDEGVASIEDDEGIEGFSVENAYLEEKEDTCNSLGEIAENVGAQFLPYLEDCYREVNILSEHSSENIRKAAIWTLGRFCKVWYQFCRPEDKPNVEYLVNSTLSSFAAMVRTDSDKTVAMATLETLDDVLKPLKEFSFSIKEDVVTSLLVSVQDIMENKAECQGADEDTHLPGEEGVAEYDNFLEESAGSILGPLAGIAGGAVFLPKIEPILPKLLKKLNGVNSTTGDKSFAVGTLAEILEGLGEHARLMFNLYQTFIDYSTEEQDDEVCSNSVYALGVLAANALPEMLTHYTTILQHLFTISQSSKGLNGRVMDNICGAICRMIMARSEAIPLDQVLPMLIQNLPLKEDMEENKTVYSCIIKLFTHNSPVVMSHLQPLLKIFAHELSMGSKLSKDLQIQLAQLLQALNSQYAGQLQAASSGLSQDQLAVLTNALQLNTETGTSSC